MTHSRLDLEPDHTPPPPRAPQVVLSAESSARLQAVRQRLLRMIIHNERQRRAAHEAQQP
jgi:hypothetical protein